MSLRKYIEADCYRLFGEPTAGLLRRHKDGGLQLRYLMLYRKAHYARRTLARTWYRLRLRKLSEKTQIQIPWSCEIGEGLYIGHLGRIIVNPAVQIGKNCNIATGVTIGAVSAGNRKGSPLIGDDVWIGTNAVIVGGVRIGSDVVIAPNSFVNFDVPSHSIVLGNPGVIHSKQHATDGYIQNKVG